MLTELRFELGDARLERLDHLARSEQHTALHIEFIARDEIEFAQAAAQGVAKIGGEIVARLARRFGQSLQAGRRNEFEQAARQLVDCRNGNHGKNPFLSWMICNGRRAV